MHSDCICSSCREQSPGFDFARAYGPYQGDLRRAIQAFKFDGLQRLSAPLAELTERCYRESELGFDPAGIVPVPLHPKRRRQRGFDQTQLLAKQLASRLSLPVLPLLRRRRHTLPQSGLAKAERRKNLRGAFEAGSSAEINGDRFILLDDVLTTGTTATEAAGELARQGAKSVLVLTIARVPLRLG